MGAFVSAIVTAVVNLTSYIDVQLNLDFFGKLEKVVGIASGAFKAIVESGAVKAIVESGAFKAIMESGAFQWVFKFCESQNSMWSNNAISNNFILQLKNLVKINIHLANLDTTGFGLAFVGILAFVYFILLDWTMTFKFLLLAGIGYWVYQLPSAETIALQQLLDEDQAATTVPANDHETTENQAETIAYLQLLHEDQAATTVLANDHETTEDPAVTIAFLQLVGED